MTLRNRKAAVAAAAAAVAAAVAAAARRLGGCYCGAVAGVAVWRGVAWWRH